MPQTFLTTRCVEFRETDMAGIVHFSNFFVYMEQAEHAFLRSLGLGVFFELDGQTITWPRVNAQCDYQEAIRFEEVMDIDVSVEQLGTKSITYHFDFRKGETPIASGRLTTVCCRFQEGSEPTSITIPAPFRTALTPYLKK